MARDEDDYEEDDRPGKSRRKNRGKNSTATILVVIFAGLGASLLCCIPLMIALLLPAVQQAREAARRTQSRNNLKQIGLAALNFDSVQGHLPPIDLNPGEQPQSWMTDLLPYLDQAPLAQAINRQAPWDDPGNRAAMSTHIMTFLNPSHDGPPRDPATGYALSHYAGNVQVLGQTMRLSEILDGASNTILAGSVYGSPKPWGDPGNLRDPANGIGPGPTQFLHRAKPADGANILFSDGVVKFISANTDPEVLKQLADPKDGKVQIIGDF